jgi:hypothetical protein
MDETFKNFPPNFFIDDDWSFNQELFDAIGHNESSKEFNRKNDNNQKNTSDIKISTTTFSPKLSPEDFLELAWIKLEDLKEKNILDIWWWCWCLALLIQNQWKPKNIEIIDPVFIDHQFDLVVKDSIKKLT